LGKHILGSEVCVIIEGKWLFYWRGISTVEKGMAHIFGEEGEKRRKTCLVGMGSLEWKEGEKGHRGAL